MNNDDIKFVWAILKKIPLMAEIANKVDTNKETRQCTLNGEDDEEEEELPSRQKVSLKMLYCGIEMRDW